MSSQITFDNNYHRRQYKPRSHNVILSPFSACRIQHYYHIDQTIYNGACHCGCGFKLSKRVCVCSDGGGRGVHVEVRGEADLSRGGGRLRPGLYEELNRHPLSVSHGSTLPGRRPPPSPTRHSLWRLGRGSRERKGVGGLLHGWRFWGKSGGGDISRETVDKRQRLAQAYLVRGVVPPRFIC